MRKRTFLLIIGIIGIGVYYDYHGYQARQQQRIRDKFIQFEYSPINLESYDTLLMKLSYKSFEEEDTPSPYLHIDDFTQCIYRYNDDTLIIDYGEADEFGDKMAFKLINDNIIMDYHYDLSNWYSYHQNSIDNVDTLRLKVDTSQQNIKADLELQYRLRFHYGKKNDYKRTDLMDIRIKGCMICFPDTVNIN